MSNVVARCNGTQMVDHDGELWIVQKSAPPHIAMFVVGLLTFIMLVNGVVQLGMTFAGAASASPIAAVILLVVGVGLVFVIRLLGQRARRVADVETPPSMIIANGKLLDRQRTELAALRDVRCAKRFQPFSSSRALALVWPSGSAIIARGNPFGDSVDGCIAALRSRSIDAA